MSIENNIERIAASLEVIAAHLTNGGNVASTPALSAEMTNRYEKPVPKQEEMTPQQKAAATKKANAARKKAEDAAAAAAQSNVVPLGQPAVGTPPAINQPAADYAPAADYNFPADLTSMQKFANAIGKELGPRVDEIGELLALTYGVKRLSELPVAYYAGFHRDLLKLVGR